MTQGEMRDCCLAGCTEKELWDLLKFGGPRVREEAKRLLARKHPEVHALVV